MSRLGFWRCGGRFRSLFVFVVRDVVFLGITSQQREVPRTRRVEFEIFLEISMTKVALYKALVFYFSSSPNDISASNDATLLVEKKVAYFRINVDDDVVALIGHLRSTGLPLFLRVIQHDWVYKSE